jgi:demethylmenaquinone methyltransferase/2-methoxy-6-polyprenyl-1,4-benzoquinol methylase
VIICFKPHRHRTLHHVHGKKTMNHQNRFVRSIFTQLAPRYDLLNRVLSLGRDAYWRRFAVLRLLESRGSRFLDLAAGTCAVSLELVRVNPAVQTVAVDFTFPMLARGKTKVANASRTNCVHLVLGDGARLPFSSPVFDGGLIAFGIRNIPDRGKVLAEMARVIIPGGVLVILEFSVPRWGRFQSLYGFSLSRILPSLGGLLSKNREAYEYLSDSIMRFPSPEVFRRMMEDAGFTEVNYWPLTLGIVGIYGAKRALFGT